MIPEYPRFTHLSLEHLREISRAVALMDTLESELAPANFYIWQDREIPFLTRINHTLCILIQDRTDTFFLPPLSPVTDITTINTCLQHCGSLSRIPERVFWHLSCLSYRSMPIPDQFDYLYRRQDLADMKGSRYDGKRNHINRFKVRFPDWSLHPLSEKWSHEALDLFDNWCEGKTRSLTEPELSESSQRAALHRAFSNFEDLGLMGIAVVNRTRMLGFLLASPLSSETAVVHFQYGLPEASGVMPLLLQEASRSIFSNFTYLNLEQDIGIAGLRKSKQSLHPHCLIKKYRMEGPRQYGQPSRQSERREPLQFV